MRGPLRFGLLFFLFFFGYAAQRRPSVPLVLERTGPIQTVKKRLDIPANGLVQSYIVVFAFTVKPSGVIDSCWLKTFPTVIVTRMERRMVTRHTKGLKKGIIKPTRRRKSRGGPEAGSSLRRRETFAAHDGAGLSRVRVGRFWFVLR
jgi:hypothetical protein